MTHMPQRNIYIREEDRDLWEWAAAHGKANRMSRSAVVLLALERYRDEIEGEGDDG